MFRRFFRRRERARTGPADERLLELERSLRAASLDLADRDQTIGRLRADLARARDGAAGAARALASTETERLIQAIATPLVQLVTQEHLQRTGTADLRAADVLEVGLRLVRGLEREGVDLIGAVGETVPFDPDRHDPLSGSVTATGGRPVTIRIVGLSYGGTVIRKAGVDSVGA